MKYKCNTRRILLCAIKNHLSSIIKRFNYKVMKKRQKIKPIQVNYLKSVCIASCLALGPTCPIKALPSTSNMNSVSNGAVIQVKSDLLSMTVHGIVKDNTGMALPGVNVIVKGESKGVITDIDGNFTIENISSSSILVFSYIGFESVEIKAKDYLEITMQEEKLN